MIRISKSVIAPLIHATTDRVEICKQMPDDILIMFRVEGIKILDKWDEIKDEVGPLLDTDDKYILFTNLQLNRFVYYFHTLAKFFSHHSDDFTIDQPYIDAVSRFVLSNTKFKKINPKVEEKMFWSAFPEKIKQ